MCLVLCVSQRQISSDLHCAMAGFESSSFHISSENELQNKLLFFNAMGQALEVCVREKKKRSIGLNSVEVDDEDEVRLL